MDFGEFAAFRQQVVNAVTPLHNSTSRGLFLDSCYTHCQAGGADTWSGDKSPTVGNTVHSSVIPLYPL